MNEDWELILFGGNISTNSPMLREFEWKTEVSFFKSPLVTSKFDWDIS